MASYSYDAYERLHPRHYDRTNNERTRHDSRSADKHSRRSAVASDEMNGRLQPADYNRYDYDNHYDYHDHYDTRPDPRYSHPRSPPRSRSRRHRSPSRRRQQWPPPPKVEEEKDALANEFGHNQTSSDDVAPSRGSIDQDPIILDVPEYIHDRRFVIVPSDFKAHGTPPTSEDEKNKRGRKKAPKLETMGLPEMWRESSPYSWTKPTTDTTKRSSGDLFLSPDTITPSATGSFASIPRSAHAIPPAVAANSASSRAPSFSITRNQSSHASARREDTSGRRPSPHTQAGATSSEEDHGRSKSRHVRSSSTHRRSYASSDVTSSAAPSMKGPSTESYTTKQPVDSSPSVPQDRLPDRSVKPPPLKSASLHGYRHASEPRSGHDSYDTAPRRASSRYPPSPPRSPRASVDRSREGTPQTPSLPNSRPGSQHASSHSSPQPSPHISKSSLTADALWGSFAAAGVAGVAAAATSSAHQPRQASRLSAAQMPEPPRAPRSVPSDFSGPQTSASLPYPVEESMFQLMPSEKDHMYLPPDQRNALQSSFEESPRPVPRNGTPSASVPIPARRHVFSAQNASVHDYPASAKSPIPARPTSSAGLTNKAKTASQLKALARPLPPCSRQSYSSRDVDWYALDGCLSFDICPECVDKVFRDTTYMCHFKPSPRRALVAKGLEVRCDFSDAWVRLGWLLTVQRELNSLDLIKNLMNTSPPHDSDEACPGAVETMRNWYSIRDRDGHFLRGFAVCSADVRKLQILFPGFRELWQPLPMRTSYSYMDDFGGLVRACSLRPALNNRFPQYIDTLVRLHEPSYQSGRMPDVSEFLSLVRRKTLLHECTRDDMLRDQAWHFIPSLLPAFTVCEDCYDEVVLPAIEADADVAMRFNREAQPVYGEGRLGSSCQLYSPRMRRVFQRAIKDNDLKYLARRAMDRKETENRLQDRVAEIRRLARRLKGGSGGYGISPQASTEIARLDDEMNALTDEWTRWE